MNGTEKQIVWAESIKVETEKKIVNFIEFVKTNSNIADEARDVVLNKLNEVSENATFWIDNRGNFKGHSDDWKEEEYKKCQSLTFLENVIAPLFN